MPRDRWILGTQVPNSQKAGETETNKSKETSEEPQSRRSPPGRTRGLIWLPWKEKDHWEPELEKDFHQVSPCLSQIQSPPGGFGKCPEGVTVDISWMGARAQTETEILGFFQL